MNSPHMTTVRLCAAAAVLVCAAAGCQSQGGQAATAGQSSAPQQAPSKASASSTNIDVCSMLTSGDIARLLGASVSGKPDAGTRANCVWKNPSTEEAIYVKIGQPDSAPNNTLPPMPEGMQDMTSAGPDGMRYQNSGDAVEFPANNRKNSVQVAVVSISQDQRRSDGVDLARKIIPQVPQ